MTILSAFILNADLAGQPVDFHGLGLHGSTCFLTTSEAAALEPGINAFGNLRPQTDVCTHQCINLRMIQLPSLLSKRFQRVLRGPHELDPQFLISREATYYSFNHSL